MAREEVLGVTTSGEDGHHDRRRAVAGKSADAVLVHHDI